MVGNCYKSFSRYHVKNFTDSIFNDVGAELRSHQEEQVTPDKIDIGALKGYGRRHRDISVRSLQHLESLSVDSVITFDGSHTVEHLAFPAVAAMYNKRDPGGAQALDRPTGHIIHVPAPIHPVYMAQQELKGHSFDFAVSHDAQAIQVWSEVEDDLLYIAETKPTGRITHDCFHIYLDGRSPEKIGVGGYTDEVLNVTICPLMDGEPWIGQSSGDGVGIQMNRTQMGYVFLCTIPWEAFGEDYVVPGVLGFDMALVSHSAEGEQNLRLSWTGREGQERDTATFGKLLIV